jgi:Domain of unknown function (DUF4190)
MSTPPEQPFRGAEVPPLEQSSSQPDPYAPVDYPAGYPTLPPPVYPRAAGYPPAGYPPAYPGYQPHDPYRQGRPQNTNGWAIAALVISLVSLVLCGVTSIIAVIIGIIAMRDTKRSGQDGFGIALAGTIIGAIPIILWLLYWLFFVVILASGFR